MAADAPHDPTLREAKIANIAAATAAVLFAIAAAWEIGGPPLAGHYASSASVGIIGENMWRWGIWGPVWEYTAQKPGPEMYYCHHPWGIFWTTALVLKIFGKHHFVLRLAPVLLSAATPVLLHKLGTAIWRPLAGAVAAWAFVVLPISLSFAHFNALEVPLMTWLLLGCWGAVRFCQTWKRRYGVAAVLGFLLAEHADWPAFVAIGGWLGLTLFRTYLGGRRFFGRTNDRKLVGLWIAVAIGSAATLALYLWLFQRSGKLDDLLGAYSMRSAGKDQPLSAVLAARRTWIYLMFTPVAIVIGVAGAPLSFVRCLALRREHEAIPLYFLAMATVQYIVFKQGADVHIFWPHPFAAYFALAMGAWAATLTQAFERAFRRLALLRRAPSWAGVAAGPMVLGLALVPIARDGISAYFYARATGGRFNEKGLLIHSDGAKTAFLEWLREGLSPQATVAMHEGMKTTWSQVWVLGGHLVSQNQALPKRGSPREAVYVADARFLMADAAMELAGRFHITAVGPFWRVDRDAPGLGFTAFSFHEREPSLWEGLWASGNEPVRRVGPEPDLLAAWEWAAHFGLEKTGPLPEAPETPSLGEKRVLHNMAVAAGEAEKATDLLRDIEGSLTPLHARFDDGTEIVGTSFSPGARPLLTVWLRAAGPTPRGAQFTVKSRVTERATLSTVPIDPAEREVGIPLGLPPERWRAGFLYADEVPIRKRPGREVFSGSFWSRTRGSFPAPADGTKSVRLLELPP